MKILFINSKSFDYLQDIIFSGLIKSVGPAQVNNWPFNYKYIFPVKAYPKNLGLHSKAISSARVIVSNIKKYDVVIVGACKPDAFRSYLKIAKLISVSAKVILLDGGDREEIGGDLIRLGSEKLFEEARAIRPFDLIFKREFFKATVYEKNIHPLPFGFNFSRIPAPILKKKYDVSFWGVESHPIRTRALQLIQNEFDCQQNGSVRNQTFKKYKRKGAYYLQELAASKIALNFRGGGWDTLRYWEVPAVGSFMISQKPAIEIPDNFEHGKHVLFCADDLSDLLEMCTYFLQHEAKREEMARAAAQHALQFHSDICRAQRILALLK